MPSLAIDRDFLLDLGKLEKPVQERVSEVFEKFESATHAGLHLERIQNARNERFRSIRINQFWRGIVLAPESGDTYVLLKVLPHDDAYDWAKRRAISVNRATGGIEIRDEAALDESLSTITAASPPAGGPIFKDVADKDLTQLGVDEKTLTFARALTDVTQLEAAQAFLPAIQWEVLYGLAAGMSPEEVWSDLGAAILDEPVDTDDIDAAVRRSRDRVVLVDGPDELMAVFANPFALWRIYLHPTQQSVADATFRGPARVTGGPGTGKTVVALHRAQRLAQRAEGKVLITTFTSTLADSLQTGITLLVEDSSVMSRIVVQHVDRVAHRVFREQHGAPRLLANADEKELWRDIVDSLTVPFTPAFLAEEWRQVVLAQRVSTASEYLAAKRTGRGRRLGANQKAQVWQAMWKFETALTTRGVWTHETVRREAIVLLESRIDKPYRHIVVDEAQDLSPDQWRLLRAAVPEGQDDMFLAGDTHQRIYDNHVSLREVGVNVTGRSSKLSVNYRTSAEILAWSLGVIRGEQIDDMDGGLDSIAGCRSDIHGDAPSTAGFSTRDLELSHVVEVVKGWIDSNVAPSEIGIAARSKRHCDKVEQALRAADIPVRALAKSTSAAKAVSVGTMHRMKGLEFRCLAVVAVGSNAVPEPSAITAADDDQQTRDRDLQRERCLLFVACTRAREQLLVTWHGEPSRFVVPLI
ncbi:UvrD-helicase domain-containing protein [Rhodococcoides corynebacterioides]|uniref:DNA 3'-5' helicase n=1 Tax=Rhodococcoides corynebacterioides TaxID=53972 RepID=A0ABS7P2A0_9NOCA|nr:UvrD-helicase domain-containing protein [Rhodococcus corynebacterioides]MBY6366535.1 DEAD/DEAH box helicase [Rhodococcus corynebacterioides]MBY6408096.1 DEAD/DEAH box helicase [Rhodococcus corynebacterioides]